MAYSGCVRTSGIYLKCIVEVFSRRIVKYRRSFESEFVRFEMKSSPFANPAPELRGRDCGVAVLLEQTASKAGVVLTQAFYTDSLFFNIKKQLGHASLAWNGEGIKTAKLHSDCLQELRSEHLPLQLMSNDRFKLDAQSSAQEREARQY